MKQSKIYLAAAALSILFYLMGLFSGLLIERSSMDYTEEKAKSLQRRMENLQLEYAYLSIAGQNLSCDSLSVLVSETTEKVRVLGKKLETKSGDNEDTLREYVFLSTKAWLFNNYIKERCSRDTVVILYFYSVPCDECIEQGHILDKVREKYPQDKFIVFVVNADIDEPIVNTLKKVNNISKTPAIVIGDKTYEGLVSEERLGEIISIERGL